MDEAIEICKLRLFLKLVAQVDTVEKIEPLPDIDFNIRAGNTLVGFASLDEVKRSMAGDFIKLQSLPIIEENAQLADRAFQQFRYMQIRQNMNPREFTQAKIELSKRLKALEDELNAHLAGEYGIKEGTKKSKEQYANWLKSHKPFHWFVDFYGIINSGGFDVIIGNPPYLELREVDYRPRGFECEESRTIHAMCIERSVRLSDSQGGISMIVPLAIVSTQRMKIVQQLIEEAHDTYYANFAWRPGKLFDTVNRALTIFVAAQNVKNRTFATNYQKWNSDTRSFLISNIRYTEVPRQRQSFWAPKLSEHEERPILSKLIEIKTHVSDFIQQSPNLIYYRTTGGLYWKVFTDFAPAFRVNGKEGHSSRETTFSVKKKEYVRPIIAVLSSDVFWWWYTITSNLRDLNPSDITYFPVPNNALTDEQLIRLGNKYIKSLVENSTMLTRHQKQTGKTQTQCFKIQISKPIIGEIDKVLAKHYGFTEEELDFIINYDIKYRMGSELNNDGDE